MAQNLTISLTQTEMEALKKSAALDCRRPQEQARFLLRSILLNTREIKTESDVTTRQGSHVAFQS